ncbi:MAG: hypothetical protein M3P98_04245 [bacterium]|nr:hypothetical protein [bacterium]
MPAKPIPKILGETYYLPLRNVPGEVLIGLEAIARAEGRSVESQARKLLQDGVKRKLKNL